MGKGPKNRAARGGGKILEDRGIGRGINLVVLVAFIGRNIIHASITPQFELTICRMGFPARNLGCQFEGPRLSDHRRFKATVSQ